MVSEVDMPEEYPFTEGLAGERSFTESLWQEKDRPPFTDLLMQSVKDIKFPAVGPFNIKLGNLDWGANATWVARLLPGQEELEDWGEQSTAQKLLTGAQFVSAAALAGMYMEKGMEMSEAFGAARLQHKEINKIAARVKREAKPQYPDPVPEPRPSPAPQKYPYQEYTTEPKVGRPYTGAVRRVPAQKPTGEERLIPLLKQRPTAQPPSLEYMAKQFTSGGMEGVVKSVKVPFVNARVVSKTPVQTAIEKMGITLYNATVPQASAAPQHAKDVAAVITAGVPNTFSGKMADTLIDQGIKLLVAGVQQLTVFPTTAPPLPKRIADIPTKLPPIKERFVGTMPSPEKEVPTPPVMKLRVKEPTLRPPLEGAQIPREEVGEAAAKIDLRGFVEPTQPPVFKAITEHQVAIFNSLEKQKRIPRRLSNQIIRAFNPKARGIGDLSEQQAEQMIERIKAAPMTPRHRLYIPPHRGDLLPMHIGGKRPAGWESYILPVWREMEVIQAQKIYNKVEPAYIEWQKRVHDMYRTFDEMKKSLKGVKGHEERIFHYVNGTLPENITLMPQETVVANQLRSILDDYADRLELPPERRLENYIYHTFEAATLRSIKNKQPFTDEKNKDVPLTDAMQSALGLNVPKKLVTSTLLHRLGRKEGLIERWPEAMRGMVSQNERYLIMGPVLKEVRPMIKDYPETSRSYINNWLAYPVLNQEPPLDKIINASVLRYAGFMEKATKGKVSFGANPAKTIGYNFAKLGYGGAVAFNLAIVGKNLTQQMLITPLLNNPLNHGKAFGDFFSEKGKYLLKQSSVLTERFAGVEAIDPKDIGTIIQRGMAPYKFVDYLNVSMAFLAGVREAQDMGLSPEEVIKYGDRIAKVSQWSYRKIDQPRIVWEHGATGRVGGMLQSWWMNYFTNYLPELTYGMFTGYDTAGNKLPAHARARLFEHIAIASLFIYGMYKYRKVDFRKTFGPGVMPSYLSPGLSLTLAIGQTASGLINNDYEERQSGLYKLSNAVPMFIPAGLQVRKTYDAYQKLTEGIDRDWAGKWKRNVSREEAITGIFTYPAQRSDFYDTQKKVGELDSRMRKIRDVLAGLEQRGASYGRIHRKEDELVKLGEQRARFAEKLAAIKEGYPTEDDKKWIEAMLHTWGLWP